MKDLGDSGTRKNITTIIDYKISSKVNDFLLKSFFKMYNCNT